VQYRRCVDDLATWVPDAKARRIIRVETPARLFGFDRPRGVDTRDSAKERDS
jgi:hypothetical protein